MKEMNYPADKMVVILWVLVMAAMTMLALFSRGFAADEETTFEIREYIVRGNTLLPYEMLAERLKYYAGQNKTSKDVEEARKYLEDLYHSEGYPTVLVNIPPQEVQEGTVVLEVIESTIGEVRVTGNRYHTQEKILSKLPSFRRGEILYIPEVQKEVNKINSGEDLKVTPVLMPGSQLGTTDIELRTVDYFPLHGSVELNNRSTHDTSNLRLNGIIRYDNLWQNEHSISLQYQTSPQDTSEVKTWAASYVLPAPWNGDHILAAYGVWSDSKTAFGEGFQVTGKGDIYGLQYALPLPFYKVYSHSISFGIDYKRLDETQQTSGGSGGIDTPVTYMPFNVQYHAGLPDRTGTTKFDAGISTVLRSIVSKENEFDKKRYKARASYLITKLGVEREQALPDEASLLVHLDGQVSDQPLISSEQYTAGGMMNVRGYKESEAVGDNALHAVFELRGPDMVKYLNHQEEKSMASYIFNKKIPETVSLVPYLFYDGAKLTIMDPLPGEDKSTDLRGAGVGFRGSLSRYLQFEMDCAVALKKTDQTDKGDKMVHFFIKGQF